MPRYACCGSFSPFLFCIAASQGALWLCPSLIVQNTDIVTDKKIFRKVYVLWILYVCVNTVLCVAHIFLNICACFHSNVIHQSMQACTITCVWRKENDGVNTDTLQVAMYVYIYIYMCVCVYAYGYGYVYIYVYM